MGRDQEVADLLLKILPNDMDQILSEEKIHGPCIRLIQGRNENKWIFTDGHTMKIPVQITGAD